MSILRQCGALFVRQHLKGASTIVPLNALAQKLHHGGQYLILPNNATQINRGFKNFGHKSEKTPKVTRYFHLWLGALFIFCLIDLRKLKKMLMPKVDADAGAEVPSQEIKTKKKTKASRHQDSDSDDESKSLDNAEKKAAKQSNKIGFRERKIIEYENRIRQFSTPDKVFRYFATIQVPTSDDRYEVYMTPTDFLTSMTPGMKQPDGLGLDQYRRYDPKVVKESLELHLEKDSIFYKLGSSGLITFSDYIFLLTVLSTSRRHFEIAFQMFDLNGDGDVDCEEFQMVATLIRNQTSIGNRHRDHAATGNTFKGVNSALTTYFFGEKLDKKLTIERFLQFQYQLQSEMLSLEFKRKNPDERGCIREEDFAELLLAYAGSTDKKKQKQLKRVKRKFKESTVGVSKEDYLHFFHFLKHINDVDTALTFYHIAGASIDQATLKHVAKTVAGVQLSDHIIDVVFTIFDEDNDNELSNKEFILVMKNRVLRGLEKPKDTGFLKLMRSMLKCANETKPVLLNV